jgi:hypothetical protein
VKDLSERPVREHQTHEQLERNREKQPDKPDSQRLTAGRWRPSADYEPYEQTDEHGANERR